MTCKSLRLLMLCAIVLVSGCANINPFANKAEDNKEQAPASIKQIEERPKIQGDEKAVEPVNKGQQRALEQIFANNRYQQSKYENAGSTKLILQDALLAYQGQEFNKALSLLNEAKAEPKPLNSAAYVLLGDIHYALWQQATKGLSASEQSKQNQADTELALAASNYDAALSLNKFNYKAANRRAMLLREQGEFQKALRLYNQAIEAYPGYALSYRNRGILYDLYLGNKRAALLDYNNYADLLSVQIAYFDKAHNQGNDLGNQQTNAQEHAQISTAAQMQISTQTSAQTNTQTPPTKSIQRITESMAMEFGDLDSLKKQLKEVQIWQIDVERQVESLNKRNGASVEHSNGRRVGVRPS